MTQTVRRRGVMNSLFVLTLMLLSIVGIALVRILVAQIASNQGWLLLAKSQYETDDPRRLSLLIEADSWFSFSISLRETAPANSGLALSNVFQISPAAPQFWARSRFPEDSARIFGQRASANSQYVQATAWAYVGFTEEHEELSPQLDRYAILLGHNCQKLLVDLSTLPALIQEACQVARHFWHSLIVNGNFEFDLAGWSSTRRNETDNDFFVTNHNLCSGMCACIRGRTNQYHGGWFQTLSLPQGKRLNARVDIVVLSNESLEVKTLSLEYRNTSQAHTKSYNIDTKDLQSAQSYSVSTQVVVPDAYAQSFRFYPLLVTGIGELCIDNVVLEFLD